ncbi:glycosyltransferase family 2 protein [Acetobacter conturbans]|uniref:Glycosyltransferase n=1 Tax=Acetobacter conturbans TaxID=1737472 RepID=A0ABX0K4T0_9PROT|nr:glycosyltransferase family 2 protein [Acetobacter conturbans]NHN88434.1 glycosyltransferase [Acetobacter conturbans]
MSFDRHDIYTIDEKTFRNGFFQIRGWAFDRETLTPIQNIIIASDNELEASPTIHLRVASPDVEQAWGAEASYARFSVDIPLNSRSNLATILSSKLILVFNDVKHVSVDLFPRTLQFHGNNFQNIKVGVGITTYNRSSVIAETIENLRSNAFLPLEIFISDDGSTDGTPDVLAGIKNICWLSEQNRGIAWNKNRTLFYLQQIAQCDVILLIEDDVRATGPDWDIGWVLATLIHHHINYAPDWYPSTFPGQAVWNHPLESEILTGQCSGFTRTALNYVGYLDSRFRQYGHEHVEHTMRMIRAGYGGTLLKEGTRDCRFLSINNGLTVLDSESSGNPEAIRENGIIFDAIWNESIYRQAWRTDEQMKTLRSEMEKITFNPQ